MKYNPFFKKAVAISALVVLTGVIAPQSFAATKKAVVKKPKAPVLSVKKFTGNADFRTYLKKSGNVGSASPAVLQKNVPQTYAFAGAAAAPSAEDRSAVSENASIPMLDRASQTNVQVAGVDEPDVLKTDDGYLYYSVQVPVYYAVPSSNNFLNVNSTDAAPSIMPIRPVDGQTKLISGLPADSVKVSGIIQSGGQLLLSGSVLMVIQNSGITAYNIQDRANPQKIWSLQYSGGSSYVDSRLMNGKLYVITQTDLSGGSSCAIQPLSINDKAVVVPCPSIYHPMSPVPSPAGITAVAVDPSTGAVQKSVSFISSGGSPIVYLSPNSLYVSYSLPDDIVKIAVDFLKQRAQDLVPLKIISKIEKMNSYDISYNSKMSELSNILAAYLAPLSGDERTRIQTELENRLQDFAEAHKRDVEKTGIVKIDPQSFAVVATGEVAGSPLNQFALDEYQGNLRIATSIGGSRYYGSIWANTTQTNDVYVLNSALQPAGKIADIGATEQIYAVRFVGARGYVVTFRQTDPLFVLNLADPAAPAVAGQLSLPGYSSYLHPLSENRILGVGMDGSKVKVSLYNVADPQNPVELSKYSLSDYWTQISSNHHAFLQDSQSQVVFIPGSDNAYVFSYAADTLTLVKTVSDISANRAAFMNNYLYVISDSKLVVLNEKDWSRVAELPLQ